jgi:sphingolipid 4-desaturase/C4-monooxygenase
MRTTLERTPGVSAPRADADDHSGFHRSDPSTRTAAATEEALWHVRRQRTILSLHPEVRELSGADPWTAVWVVALVGVQWTVAFELRDAHAWLILLAVLFFGAPIAHALGVLIHECAHNLVFRQTWRNKALGLVANLGIVGPGAMAFRHQHLMHHRLLGDARERDGGDTQAPTLREIRLSGRSPWKRLFFFTFGHFTHRPRVGDAPPREGWLLANNVLCAMAGVTIGLGFGLRSLAYVMFSLLFAFGPHPLGARRLSEHWTLRRGQPTCSYYGLANWISFRVGYHVEHHDFPHVPWSRLGRLRTIAHGHYEHLGSFSSWTLLLAKYLFVPRWDRGHYVGFSDDYLEGDRATPAFDADITALPRHGWQDSASKSSGREEALARAPRR